MSELAVNAGAVAGSGIEPLTAFEAAARATTRGLPVQPQVWMDSRP